MSNLAVTGDLNIGSILILIISEKVDRKKFLYNEFAIKIYKLTTKCLENTSAKISCIANSLYEFIMEFLHNHDSFLHVTY